MNLPIELYQQNSLANGVSATSIEETSIRRKQYCYSTRQKCRKNQVSLL